MKMTFAANLNRLVRSPGSIAWVLCLWLCLCITLAALPTRGIAGSPAKSQKQDPWPKDFEEALQNPGKVTLYSLDPLRMNSVEQRQHEGEALYQYKVLGKTPLSAGQAKEAIAEFKTAVTLWDGDWAKCFNPRHALRIERDGGQSYDLLLCYECSRMLAWKDGKYMFHYGVGGQPEKLNALLSAAGVPLAKKPGEQ
ncbi:MAG: hypothetical protein ACAI35_19430 [Candidatus Methylacidiphilales bacterium]|nr:hypothetical protein [Candidatus Methylacidiphilales bacterium]